MTDTTSAAHDLTEAQEAAIMGFASGLDAEQPEAEPEGPPAVLLAGFRVEEVPRVRELLDELGGHDVPVLPVIIGIRFSRHFVIVYKTFWVGVGHIQMLRSSVLKGCLTPNS